MRQAASSIQPRQAAAIAVRAQQAADMLGISLSELNKWVKEGKIHKPYTVKRNIVLFDVGQLLSDWEMIKADLTGDDEYGDDPWGDAVKKHLEATR